MIFFCSLNSNSFYVWSVWITSNLFLLARFICITITRMQAVYLVDWLELQGIIIRRICCLAFLEATPELVQQFTPWLMPGYVRLESATNELSPIANTSRHPMRSCIDLTMASSDLPMCHVIRFLHYIIISCREILYHLGLPDITALSFVKPMEREGCLKNIYTERSLGMRPLRFERLLGIEYRFTLSTLQKTKSSLKNLIC